jgi:hypothetical protein
MPPTPTVTVAVPTSPPPTEPASTDTPAPPTIAPSTPPASSSGTQDESNQMIHLGTYAASLEQLEQLEGQDVIVEVVR